MKIELLSRSIDALWKTGSYNKMWVLFVNLTINGVTIKRNDYMLGSQDLRYCADGGVYYAYNYVENGNF